MAYTKYLIGAAVVGALLIGGAAATLAQAGDSDGPVSCEIATEKSGRMLTLTSYAHVDQSTSGSYRLTIKSVNGGGSTNIRQGGGFSATAGDPTMLGTVALSANSTYEVELEIEAAGVSQTCFERVPNII